MTCYVNSPAFRQFIALLELKDEDRLGDHYICLTCWAFVNYSQMLLHQRYMHVCANPGSIYDEQSFLKVAYTYNRFNKQFKTVQIMHDHNKDKAETIDQIKSDTRQGIYLCRN